MNYGNARGIKSSHVCRNGQIVLTNRAMCEKPTSQDVTTAMVEAGVASVRSTEYGLWESRSPEQLAALVTAVFNAMKLKELEH